MRGAEGVLLTTCARAAQGSSVTSTQMDADEALDSLKSSKELTDRLNEAATQQQALSSKPVVATGIPDSANGLFEITGLASQYTTYATVQRYINWTEGSWSKVATSGAPTDRQRKQQDSRRLRNKI